MPFYIKYAQWYHSLVFLKFRIIIRFPFPFIYVEQTCIHQFRLYNMFIVHQIPYTALSVHLCPDFKKHPSQYFSSIKCTCVFVRVSCWRIFIQKRIVRIFSISIFVNHKVIVGFIWRCIAKPTPCSTLRLMTSL